MQDTAFKLANIVERSLTSNNGIASTRAADLSDYEQSWLCGNGLRHAGFKDRSVGQIVVPDYWSTFEVVNREKAEASIAYLRTAVNPLEYETKPIEQKSYWATLSCP